MNPARPHLSRRTLLSGAVTAALTSVAYTAAARQSTARAASPAQAPAPARPAHPSYHSIVGLL